MPRIVARGFKKEVFEKVATAVNELFKPLGYETVMISFKDIDLAYEFVFKK